MSTGGRVPAFNCLDAGGDETFEELVDFFVEIGIFDRDPNLMAKGDEVLEIAVFEESIMLSIDRLKHAQEAPVGADWDTDHVLGDEPAGLIGLAKESGIALDVVDDQRFSGASHMAGDALTEPKPYLPD
jgi:hypothetical protein